MQLDLNLIILMTALASGLTILFTVLAFYAVYHRPSRNDVIADRLDSLMTSEIEHDEYDLPNGEAPKKTWSQWWLSLYKKTGRVPEDDKTPGRIPVIAALTLGVFGLFVWPGDFFGFIIGVGLGIYVPYAWLSFEVGRRAKTLDKQLPILLNSLRSNLQGTYTPQAALIESSKEVPSPLGEELKKVKDDISVNIPLPEALDRMAERLDSADIKFMLAAIQISIREGSDLDKQLEVIQGISRQRVRIQQRLAAAVAAVKPSLWISIGVIPLSLIFSIYSSQSNREFWFSLPGIGCIALVVVFYGVGLFITRLLVRNVEKS